VSNNACTAALIKLYSEDTEDFAANSWVSTCWLILTKSLHDDILLKVAHVERGHIETLLKEIAASLVVHTLDEVGPLRLELYAASMLKNGNSDLQAYIAYLQMRQRKLALKKPVTEDELVSIFKGLHPLFQPLQVHLAIVKPVKWGRSRGDRAPIRLLSFDGDRTQQTQVVWTLSTLVSGHRLGHYDSS